MSSRWLNRITAFRLSSWWLFLSRWTSIWSSLIPVTATITPLWIWVPLLHILITRSWSIGWPFSLRWMSLLELLQILPFFFICPIYFFLHPGIIHFSFSFHLLIRVFYLNHSNRLLIIWISISTINLLSQVRKIFHTHHFLAKSLSLWIFIFTFHFFQDGARFLKWLF